MSRHHDEVLAIIEQHLPLTAALPCVFLFAGVAARRRMPVRPRIRHRGDANGSKTYMGYVLGCGISQESGMPLGFRCEYRGEASGECESVRVNGGARAVVLRSSSNAAG